MINNFDSQYCLLSLWPDRQYLLSSSFLFEPFLLHAAMPDCKDSCLSSIAYIKLVDDCTLGQSIVVFAMLLSFHQGILKD
ncbi:hypothetical protein PMIT1342_00592 [Prochlorococcus marinus str. MIT 1342]|nr:hypothetical protein PMIT1342_00592 [Prochlorococcus marinus str. MIT 1342]